MDLYAEFQALLKRLEESGVPYALCGGMALAVYGLTRATEDIDLLLPRESLSRFREITGALGYRLNPSPLLLKGGDIEIQRLLKAIDDEILVLDVIMVSELTDAAWQTRRQITTAFGQVTVVSPAGLIHLKSLRNSAQDQADIARLSELNDES